MGRVPWELCSAHPVRLYKTWWSCYYGCVKVVLFKEDAICYEPSMECVLQQTGGGQQFTREKQVDLYIRKQTRALSWLPRTAKKRPSCNGVGGRRGAPAHPTQGALRLCLGMLTEIRLRCHSTRGRKSRHVPIQSRYQVWSGIRVSG